MILSLLLLAGMQATPDPNVPDLTLEEKIALATDDVKKSDIYAKLQKQFLLEIKPIQDHQEGLKKVIEKEHEGWTLTQTQQGWVLVKSPDPKAAKTPDKK